MVTDPAQLLQAADTYAATFAGHRAAYTYWNGEYWATAYDWNEEGAPVTPRPLTPEVVVDAFTKGVPISGYAIGQDNLTHVACLDIDRADGQALAILIARHIRDLGGEGYIERSRRGAHAWMILDERRPAILVRRGLMALVQQALGDKQLCPGSGQRTVPNSAMRPSCSSCHRGESTSRAAEHRDPRIEFRPASDRLPAGEGKLGHCIRLPTMPHHKTGKRYPLISFSEGVQLPGTLVEMMSEVATCPASIFEDLAQECELPRLQPAPNDLSWPHGRPAVTQTASEILRELWGVHNAQPGKAVRCPAHDDQRPSLSIARDDERAWCHSPICELHNDGRGRGTYELTMMAPQIVAHG